MKRLIQESDPVQSDGGDETIRALIADAMRISARTEPSLVNVIFRSYEEKLAAFERFAAVRMHKGYIGPDDDRHLFERIVDADTLFDGTGGAVRDEVQALAGKAFPDGWVLSFLAGYGPE